MGVGMTLTMIRNYPEYPEPLADVYRLNPEGAADAEQLGFDFVWVSPEPPRTARCQNGRSGFWSARWCAGTPA